MSKKRECLIYYFLGVFFILINSANALVISEINFDPDGSDTDREWIEIYNDTANTVDLTEIKFFEANVNHGIDIWNQTYSTDKNILNGEYVVVVQDINKFRTDFPNFTGKIFKASFSLSNTGEYLALKDAGGNILYSLNYSAADKQSVPSPGQGNVLLVGGTGNVASSTTSTSTNSNSQNTNENQLIYSYRSYWPENERIYLSAGRNKIVMQGQQVVFNPVVLDGYKKEIKNGVQYRWNFGDGYTSTKKEGPHTYKFVGEFVANLRVNFAGYEEEDIFYIKVVEPKLVVKIVEKNIDGNIADVIEIKNENNFDLDLGNLNLINELNKTFLLPEKLIIMSNRSVYLAPYLTGFSSSTSKVELKLLSGKVLSSHFKNVQPKLTLSSSTTLDSNIIQVFTPEQFANNQIQNNLKIQSLGSTTKKNFSKKFLVHKNQDIKDTYTTPPAQTQNNLNNTNKLEFKNETTGFIQKFKNFFGL